MADKVLQFPCGQTVEEFLNEVREEALQAKKIAVILQCEDGYTLTGYHNCNFTDKAVLAQHILFDAIHQSLDATFDLIRKED
jgi:hypothetical protein